MLEPATARVGAENRVLSTLYPYDTAFSIIGMQRRYQLSTRLLLAVSVSLYAHATRVHCRLVHEGLTSRSPSVSPPESGQETATPFSMADWSSIASEWVETDRRRDTRTTTLDAASSSSSEGSRGRQLIADSILSALPVIPTDGPQSFHRLGPNLILPSLLARPNSDPEVSDSSAKDDDNDGSARSSVSSMKGMRTLRPVTASYVIELAEGTHQDRMIRELASTVHLIVHPTNDPVAMERMYDIFASRKVHLHGVWLADLWFYT